MNLQFSFIIPVYNRPQEIAELLESLAAMEGEKDFEIVIVEDGSEEALMTETVAFPEKLKVSYYYKENSGPGDSRNYGMRKAKGNYFIILDSDCLLPPHYMNTVSTFLNHQFVDCFGGADAAHPSFSMLQKAINYVMTSFLTTGGIRGNRHQIGKFEPRSFNMGLSKKAFEATKGFSNIHPGEDPDLSQRVLKAGFQSEFIPDAFVYHKRRISWNKFYTQVKKFGLVRPILNLWHPKAAKITFWFPSLFVLFCILSIVGGILVHPFILLPLGVYLLTILLDASIKNRSLTIGVMSVFALFVQFFGYGLAFLKSTYKIHWLKKEPQKAFPNLFFK